MTMRPSAQLATSCLLLLCCHVMTSCQDKSPTAPEIERSYPTIITPLSADSLAALRQELALANIRLCSGLNEYGFTYDRDVMCEARRSKGLGPDPDHERLAAIAMDTLVRNAKFTGVADSSGLELRKVRRSSVPEIAKLTFEEQLYQGLLVDRTYITVVMDTVDVFAISGNHYPDIYVPTPAISSEQAQESLIGKVLLFGGFSPPDTLVVAAEHMNLEPERVILPRKTDEGIELRVTWRVPVAGDYGWHIFVDSMTKECLLVRHLIIY